MKTIPRWTVISALIALITVVPQPAHAVSYTFNPAVDIPDASTSGLSDSQSISAPFTSIQSLTVFLDIGSAAGSSAFNGDLYAYLQYGSTLVPLLNRPGRTGSNPFGYGDSGLQVTFDDAATRNVGGVDEPADIHNYQGLGGVGSPLTGVWQADGREFDPSIVKDTDLRTASLSDFSGLDPNGDWTLFVADLGSGGVAKLNSWSLNIVGVPEPGLPLACLAGAWALLAALRGPRRWSPSRMR